VPDTKTTPSHVTGATPTGPSSPIPQYRDRGTTPHDYKRYITTTIATTTTTINIILNLLTS
jgi:hypothetical protein